MGGSTILLSRCKWSSAASTFFTLSYASSSISAVARLSSAFGVLCRAAEKGSRSPRWYCSRTFSLQTREAIRDCDAVSRVSMRAFRTRDHSIVAHGNVTSWQARVPVPSCQAR
eukprot:7185084-Pyramimonas_sp.AAC.2